MLLLLKTSSRRFISIPTLNKWQNAEVKFYLINILKNKTVLPEQNHSKRPSCTLNNLVLFVCCFQENPATIKKRPDNKMPLPTYFFFICCEQRAQKENMKKWHQVASTVFLNYRCCCLNHQIICILKQSKVID